AGAENSKPEHATVASYFAFWIEEKRPPEVRASLRREYKNHFERHILPVVGDVPLRSLSKGDLLRLRSVLRAKKVSETRCLSEKTVRNVIDGTFRAFYRDAAQEHDGIPYPHPFSMLQWAQYIPPEPDPFTEDERDRLLEFYRRKLWKVGGFNERRPHYPYYGFLFSLFFTGCRPS
ncbi:MAG: hypothetical protein ACREQQ_04280, partial [Candidatus Binatia bacterium]